MAGTRKEYVAKDIAVSFDGAYCIHAANCINGLPQVFDLNARPWIAPDAAAVDEVVDVVERCPSGALQYRRLDGGADEAAGNAYIFPIPNGPLFVRGQVDIADGEGAVIRTSTRMTLCRCGGSANKPFCDNSHRRNGFTTE